MEKIVLLIVTSAFSKIVTTQHVENSFSKCCESDHVMKFENSSIYVCDNVTSNIKIVNDRNLIEISEVFCLEVYEQNIFVFEKTNEGFKKAIPISPQVYPKCCPLGYNYNTRIHSCEENIYSDKNLSRFLRIGLPHCKIIFDYKSNKPNKFDLVDIKSEDYCLDKTQDNFEVLRTCTSDLSVCESMKCLHKCCIDGHSFVNGSHCKPTYIYGLDVNFSKYIDQDDDFGIIHGYTGMIYLQPLHWEFHLDSKGVFRYFDENVGNEIYGPTEETYCIEHATKMGVNLGYRIFRKHLEETIEFKYVVNGYVMIISSIFILLTIIVYIILRETKKLFGKTLVSFCLSLLMDYLLLIYITFNSQTVKANIVMCHTFGFLLLFAGFATFLWLKLLCFDIYYTFGSGKIRNDSHNRNNTKRFLLYSLYGWGLSLLLTTIPISFSYVDILPEPIQIKMGIARCAIDRFNGNYADILFRTVPLTIIQTVNFLLFLKTIRCCMQVKNEISRMNNSCNRDHNNKKFLGNKERFILVMKLSVIMGISYIFEVISSFYDFNKTKPTKYLEIVWDIFNCLQGVFIFVIFICKKKIIDRVKIHNGVRRLRKISLSSAATLTTNISFDKDKKKNEIIPRTKI